MRQSRTNQNPDWKDGFLFIGNHLALDFLNTHPVQNGEPVELLSDFTALVRWFKAADLLTTPQTSHLQRHWGESARAGRAVQAVRALREKLREEVVAWEQGTPVRRSTIVELNRLMTEHPMHTRLEESGTAYSIKLWFKADDPEDLLAPLAHSVATLFADAERNRVRKCGCDVCVLHFLDTSKKGTRRWCSMQICGNRLKVAAYAARHRKHDRRLATRP